MSKQRASCFIATLSLLACISTTAAAQIMDPCKWMQHTLDRQIDNLKAQQKGELRQCEQGNGRGAAACLSLKDQQQQSLRAMRDDRSAQMNGCRGSRSLTATTLHTDQNNTYYNQADNHYPDNDQYPDNNPKARKVPDPHPRHPRHPPVPTNGGKSASSDKPAKGSDHSGDKNSHANAGSSSGGSTASTGHSHNGGGGGSYSGSSHSSSGGGGSYSGSSHSSGGGSSSYSGGSSGSSGSSHSSGGGGGSYSGGSSSSGSSSSSSSSGASGGRPK